MISNGAATIGGSSSDSVANAIDALIASATATRKTRGNGVAATTDLAVFAADNGRAVNDSADFDRFFNETVASALAATNATKQRETTAANGARQSKRKSSGEKTARKRAQPKPKMIESSTTEPLEYEPDPRKRGKESARGGDGGAAKKRKRAAAGDAAQPKRQRKSTKKATATAIASKHLPLPGDDENGAAAAVGNGADLTSMVPIGNAERDETGRMYDDLDSLNSFMGCIERAVGDADPAPYVPTPIQAHQQQRYQPQQQQQLYQFPQPQQVAATAPCVTRSVNLPMHTKEPTSVTFDPAKQSEAGSFHAFAQQHCILQTMTKEEQRGVFPALRQYYNEQQQRFCRGKVARRAAKDMLRTLLFGVETNVDHCRLTTAYRLYSAGFVVNGDCLNRYTDSLLLKLIALWYIYADNDSCQWRCYSLDDVERMLVNGEMFGGPACTDCVQMFIRLNRGGMCPELYKSDRSAAEVDDYDIAAAVAVVIDEPTVATVPVQTPATVPTVSTPTAATPVAQTVQTPATVPAAATTPTAAATPVAQTVPAAATTPTAAATPAFEPTSAVQFDDGSSSSDSEDGLTDDDDDEGADDPRTEELKN